MGINLPVQVTSGQRLYWFMWHRASYNQGAGTNSSVTWNMKPWILYSGNIDQFYIGFDSGIPSTVQGMTLRTGGTQSSNAVWANTGHWNAAFEQTWLGWEHEIVAGAGQAGGFRLWLHDETPSIALEIDAPSSSTWGAGEDWTNLRIGEYFRYFQMEYTTEYVYVDTTFKRLMFGDASTYSACTRREVQVASSWQNGAITGAARSGGLDFSAPIWAYAIDESGTVINENGVPIN
jgi:hypothetical protein